MKKTTTLFAFLFVAFAALAQDKVNLIIFSEDLEPFYAYVNGVKQNANPETNVRIANITPNIALRIEFSNKALPLLKQNMALEPNFEHTARLKYDKNKVMKLRYFGSVPMTEAVKDNAVKTVAYHTTELPETTNTHINTNTTDLTTMPTSSGINITSSTVTTRQTTNTGGRNENGGVNVTMPGINMNVTINDPFANTTMQTTTSSTVTTSSSDAQSGEIRARGTRQQTETSPQAPQPVIAKAGCAAPMTAAAFSAMKTNIESKPFSETRMSTARIATKNTCLSVQQVKDIAGLFNMDDDKLAYAKFAYDYCVDKANYYQVSDIFSFSSTTDNFNQFLDK